MNSIRAIKNKAFKSLNSDSLEKGFFDFIKTFMMRLLSSLFLFKKRKGEVLAGATTFFAILSFGPATLLLISLIGFYLGDSDSAKDHVIETLFLSFPKLDPFFLKSLQNLAHEQISSQVISFDQLGLWFFACLGISTSVVFGINILSKVDPDGGFFQDDVRSVLFGVVIAIFFFLVFMLLEKDFIINMLDSFIDDSKYIVHTIDFLLWPISLLFFAFFYKYSTQIKVDLFDALQGAFVFAMFFLLGKYFYWIYLTYFKEDLYQEYGKLYHYLVAIIWLYYIVSCFYLGASFTFVNKVDIFEVRKVKAKSRKK